MTKENIKFHKSESTKLRLQIIELNKEISDLKNANNFLNNTIKILIEFILPNQWNELEKILKENKSEEYLKVLLYFNQEKICLKSKNYESPNNSKLEVENKVLKDSNLILRKLVKRINDKFKNHNEAVHH